MAVQCLKILKKSDLDEIKALKKPPGGVKLAMEACCIMFQVQPVKVNDPDRIGKKMNDYWAAALAQVLNDPKKLLDDLMTFDQQYYKQGGKRTLTYFKIVWEPAIVKVPAGRILLYLYNEDVLRYLYVMLLCFPIRVGIGLIST